MHIRKRRKLFRRNRIGIIYASLIFLLNVVGIGYGNWQGEIKVENVISTGNIRPVFTQCKVSEDNNQKLAVVKLSQDKKQMSININNAYPGYCAKITYTVTNEGSIPIYCKIAGSPEKSDAINITVPEGIIKGYGDSKEGAIVITANDLIKQETQNNYESDSENYHYTVNLLFKQYNMLDK